MLFAWDDLNRGHLAKHNVTPAEAEEIVRSAEPPYPMEIGDDKLVVWGVTTTNRYLQVIYVLKSPAEIPYESLTADEWSAVEAGEIQRIVRIIHGMDLSPAMKKRFRRRR